MGAEEGGVVCIEERVDVEEADGKAVGDERSSKGAGVVDYSELSKHF